MSRQRAITFDQWIRHARHPLLQAVVPSPLVRLAKYSYTGHVLEELESDDLCVRVVGYYNVPGEEKMGSYATDASKSNA